MDNYLDTLKTRLNDSAYEYRRDAFLAFLRAPVRDYKESPTVKDYVEIGKREVEALVYQDASSSQLSTATREDGEDAALYGLNFSVGKVQPGVIITDMRGAMEEHLETLRAKVFDKFGDDKIEFLINSAWQNGYFIEVADGATAQVDIHVEWDSRISYALKNVVIVGRDANLRLFEHDMSTGQGDGVHGKTIYFIMGQGSKVEFNYLQEKEKTTTDITYVKSFQDRYSAFNIYHINYGSAKVLFSNESQQAGDYSDFRVNGISFSAGTQKMDIRDSSFQLGIGSTSDIQVRGVVSGQSVTIHRGNVDLEEVAKKSSGFYDSKILLLSKEGYANSKPGLMIKNNDTRSKHASAISSLDEEQVFYLRSRGIPAGEAKSMVAEGFIASVADRASHPRFRSAVERFVKELDINA
ncbi:hypothetical protein GCM10007108_01160 [Thermogymnomonas acidicola]|uniref:SUF system FeS cluster assembly SufBD core domain-containing protein n=1 Tax=Thermogymnomonas acidicola TaxID=399579 RepID=A0AA37F8L9_9ARCH|nr:SufD family Fe-S cluster assembly protein [Thermogymnomonas acidicola]GGM66731.1 hypothetical protein GCM10007108_01160 [Thermogymnomonas acidicola]